VAAERRTDEEIRHEIGAERQQLAEALTDLRAEIESKRRLATATATLAAAGLAAVASIKLVRRFRG
jgi:hypothetical protein